MAVFQRKPVRKDKAAAEAEPEAAASGGLLGSLKKRSGGLMDRVAGSVKDAARSSLLKQAIEARERGNLAAAFHLAKEEYGNHPDEPHVAGLYWDVAVAYERPAEAIAAVAGLIRKNALAAHELAMQYWVELDSLVPGTVIDPSTLARLVPHLAKQVEEDKSVELPEPVEGKPEDPDAAMARAARAARESALRSAIRGIVDERNCDALTAGLAMHVAELARELDPPSALAAARHALGCEEVHQTKRERLQALISELDPSAPAPPSPAQETGSPVASSSAEPQAAPAPAVGVEPADAPDASAVEEHPARNHPLREHAPRRTALSDAEVAALQRRLPPSRSAAQTAEQGGDTQTEAADPGLEMDDQAVPEPAPEPESPADPDPDILSESSPELEVDPLEVSHPQLEVDGDLLESAEAGPVLGSDFDLDAAVEAAGEVVGEAAVEDGAESLADVVAEVIAEAAADDAARDAALDADGAGADRSETMDALAALDPQPDPDPAFDPDLPTDPGLVAQPAPIPVDPSVEAPLFPDLKRMPAQPSGLEETALLIQVAGSRRARIELDQVQAIAVGEVGGLADEPVVVIDLLMDVREVDGAPLRLVRLRGDEFDPRQLMPDAPDAGAALQAFLGTLMERTRAMPLPDPEAALGLIVPRFDTLDEYEQQVLQVRR
jgi:hypothetical protein